MSTGPRFHCRTSHSWMGHLKLRETGTIKPVIGLTQNHSGYESTRKRQRAVRHAMPLYHNCCRFGQVTGITLGWPRITVGTKIGKAVLSDSHKVIYSTCYLFIWQKCSAAQMQYCTWSYFFQSLPVTMVLSLICVLTLWKKFCLTSSFIKIFSHCDKFHVETVKQNSFYEQITITVNGKIDELLSTSMQKEKSNIYRATSGSKHHNVKQQVWQFSGLYKHVCTTLYSWNRVKVLLPTSTSRKLTHKSWQT